MWLDANKRSTCLKKFLVMMMISELHTFFSVMNRLIGGLEGSNTMSAFISLRLFQLGLGGFQVLKSGAHVRLFFNRCGSHGYRRGEDSQENNQRY
jgi:hypothetical protein